MKLKNILLLLLSLLTVFFVGCSRQTRVIPQVTPQKTATETPSVVPDAEYPDTTVRQGAATGTDVEVKTGTATGVDRDAEARTGTAIGEDTGNKVGTGTDAESKVGNGGSLEHGTYNGNLYVSTKNFRLIDTRVNGNVYFTTDEAKSTFTMDATSKVTGRQELRK